MFTNMFAGTFVPSGRVINSSVGATAIGIYTRVEVNVGWGVFVGGSGDGGGGGVLVGSGVSVGKDAMVKTIDVSANPWGSGVEDGDGAALGLRLNPIKTPINKTMITTAAIPTIR